MCSSATFVRSTTFASIVFVASCRPPSPASIAAALTPRAAKSAKAAAVTASNCVAPTASAAGRTRSIARAKPSRSVCSRSCQPETCGEV